MTDRVVRLYGVSLALLVFFLAWVVIAARPWVAATPDPRVAALAAREQRIQHESLVVKRLLDQRWAAYRHALSARQKSNAATQALASAPSVRVVTLPPLTVTRTS